MLNKAWWQPKHFRHKRTVSVLQTQKYAGVQKGNWFNVQKLTENCESFVTEFIELDQSQLPVNLFFIGVPQQKFIPWKSKDRKREKKIEKCIGDVFLWRRWKGDTGVKFWLYNFGYTILVVQFWLYNFGYTILGRWMRTLKENLEF
jgi:hypothetical protein